MTDSDRSLSEVPGLIDERRRYEGWLSALDARREATPKHVFERVQSDYRGRLQRVADQLASYKQAIDEECASVQARIALLEAEEQLQRDERAELELRAHVGELSLEDASGSFGAVDQQIERLVTEKATLGTRVVELQALLHDRPPSPGSPPEEGRNASSGSEPVASGFSSSASGEQKAAGAQVTSPAGLAQQLAPSGTNGASFDELEFLTSVSKAEPERREARRDSQITIDRRGSDPVIRSGDGLERDELTESLLAGIDKGNRTGNDAPLGANSPIVLRPTGTLEQAKTLKCNECGAMNYPTEWYCERCGAELAAL
jgi:hypothetical protein